MTFWLALAGMVAVTFGSRYAGLALRIELPAFWVRFLHFVPIAVFAALVTPSLEGDLGEFVALCPSSHRAQNDPIVFPGQPGQSHLHSFFGSTTTDASSTLGTLLAGGTTCDPAVDRSAYWVPTLLENGVPIRVLTGARPSWGVDTAEDAAAVAGRLQVQSVDSGGSR